MPVHREYKRMVKMKFGKSADSVRRQKLIFVENVAIDALKLRTICNRQKQAAALLRLLAHIYVLPDFRIVVQKPLHSFAEIRQSFQNLRLENFHRKERNQADHRSNFHRHGRGLPQVQNVVIETVLFIPQAHSLAAHVVHSLGDIHEVFEKLAGDVFVSGILMSELHRDREHVEAIHGHPTGAIGLLDKISWTQGLRTVENADIIEAEETAF